MLEITLDCKPKRTEAEKAMMRQAFEAYSDGQRNLSLEAVISTASATYKAVSVAGPLGLLVIPVGLLKAWWSKKSYREESYAFFDAMGWMEPAWRPIVGILPQPFDPMWLTPFGAGCIGSTARAVVAIMEDYDPTFTDYELLEIGRNVIKTFQEHELKYPDMPDAIVAEVILASHGIYREPTENGFIYDPGRGEEVAPEPDEPKPDEAYATWLYAAAGLAIALVFARR